jgi:predicted oxidoreductase
MEPEEVAEAFTMLHSSGKVRYFGVSNQNPMQIELLSRYLSQKIIINQLQMSITNTGMIDVGLNVNMQIDCSIDRDGSILDYCRLKDITVQAWSPFQYGFFEGVFLDNGKFPELNQKIIVMGKCPFFFIITILFLFGNSDKCINEHFVHAACFDKCEKLRWSEI